MRVFGIDPGSTVTGWGVVQVQGSRMHFIDAGFVRTTPRKPIPERLMKIYDELHHALVAHPVDAVAIEAIFRHKSSESALRLGQARGVALLAAMQVGHVPFEYNAMTVKAAVGAHGRADKKAVGRMVGMLLGSVPEGPEDQVDALAIAITHCMNARAHRMTGARAR